MNGVLRVLPSNPRYFTDNSGKAIYLTGSHTWTNLQDRTSSVVMDYERYLRFLKDHNHNFIRLWFAEEFMDVNSDEKESLLPCAYVRSDTPGANGGGNKFDLSRLNEAFFERLRARVKLAMENGIYVSVMLFQGWSVFPKLGKDPWPGHPYHPSNNVNGIDGSAGTGFGGVTHTHPSNAVRSLQYALVDKFVVTVGDLDNVLFEISNEDDVGEENTAWQNDMIGRVRKALREHGFAPHAVGFTMQWSSESNAVTSRETLLGCDADWVSPSKEMYVSDGTKVVIWDTDHTGCDTRTVSDIWMAFAGGCNVIFMDYNARLSKGDFSGCDRDREMGATAAYAERMDLARAFPRADLCSTGHCLANPGKEYLVFNPGSEAFTVDLAGGLYESEWRCITDGATLAGASVLGGGRVEFTPPFEDAVLFLQDQHG